jgi:hypothetical protein
MSSNPNSGLGGYDSTSTSATHNTADNQPGVVEKVLSYIPGMSPTTSRDHASGTTDATAEPAFGAAVNPNSSHSHTGTGSSGLGSSSGIGAGSDTFGSSNTSGPHGSNLANQADPRVDSDNSRLGSSNTSGLGSSGALGSSSTGYGSSTGTGALGSSSTGYGSSNTSGPHGSNLANQARVDSDNSRLGSSNTSGLGSSHTGTGALGSSSTGYGSSTTSGPHDSNLANKADPRVDSDNSRLGSTHNSGLGSSHTGTGSSTFGESARDPYTPAPTLNPHDEDRARVVAERAVGATGTTIGSDAGLGSGRDHEHSRGSGFGTDSGLVSSTGNEHIPGVASSGLGHEHSHGSGVGSGVGLGSGAALGGAALGSGLGHDSSRGSGAGLDSTRESGVGLGSGRESGVGLGSDRRAGDEPSEFREDKTDRALAGASEGATAEESRASAENRHTDEHHSSNPAKRENKDAIPTAGGIKLGEKHWGESDIVPDNPKPRNENVSSSHGQPDR